MSTMTDPAPITEALERHPLASASAALAAAAARIAARGETPEDRTVAETAEEAAERAALGLARRTRLWEAGVPLRFRQARLADLESERGLDQRVTAWWGSGRQNLLMWSEDKATGKSHAAYAVGYDAVLEHGATAIAWTVAGYLDALRPGSSDEANRNVEAAALEADLLVLDDLGSETTSASGWSSEQLLQLIDGRWANARRTLITTNLNGTTLASRYDERLIDRICDDAVIVNVTGAPRRRPAPY